jgi:hypothetical protein
VFVEQSVSNNGDADAASPLSFPFRGLSSCRGRWLHKSRVSVCEKRDYWMNLMGLDRVELPTSRLSGSFIRTRNRRRCSYSPAFHEHPAQHLVHIRTSCAGKRSCCASEWTPQRTPCGSGARGCLPSSIAIRKRVSLKNLKSRVRVSVRPLAFCSDADALTGYSRRSRC